MNIGVFANDPGGHSGIAWGIFDSTVDTAESLRTRQMAGSVTTGGTAREQILEIADLWMAFYDCCVNSALLPPQSVWNVCENYIQRPGQTSGGLDAGISTSIIWGVEGYRYGRAHQFKQEHPDANVHMPSMILQMAGDAKAWATRDRLKDWNVWVTGREHERSAWAHIALFIERYRKMGVGKTLKS